MRQSIGGSGGWGGILNLFATRVAAVPVDVSAGNTGQP